MTITAMSRISRMILACIGKHPVLRFEFLKIGTQLSGDLFLAAHDGIGQNLPEFTFQTSPMLLRLGPKPADDPFLKFAYTNIAHIDLPSCLQITAT